MSEFQSTPPRGGRRRSARIAGLGGRVSIHAPAWGATHTAISCLSAGTVSIHAPAWGATHRPPRPRTSPRRFNPRPRVGGDVEGGKVVPDRSRFNPRPRVGGDPPAGGNPTGGRGGFNPRPRVGGDLAMSLAAWRVRSFQSTPPRGGRRQQVYEVDMTADVSIHAPAWGATQAGADRARVAGRFNPRPRVGGDRCRPGCGRGGPRFNPRPRVGGDASPRPVRISARRFQSTPPRGGRRPGARPGRHPWPWFQSTPPRGGRLRFAGNATFDDLFQSTPPRGGRPMT